MMHVHASAPGKLVIAGDYAVLEGAPAVVLALDRRARVDLTPGVDDRFCVDAPDLGIHAVHGSFDRGQLHWTADRATADKLALVTCTLQALAQVAAPDPLHITLDTGAFFDTDGATKLGLGSSAALTVALAGAVHAAGGHPPPQLGALIAMHRDLQGGRGSGLDIAASLLGGAIVYRLRDGQPQAVRASWPSGLVLCCVWTGRAASTGAALARLDAWRDAQPTAYTAHMRELAASATAVATALEAGDAEAMADGMAAYAGGLQRLGDASGIDIVCAEHRVLARAARACGVAYKTCGAGGGDVGVAVATDPDRLTHFSRQAASAGFRILETAIDAQGLSVDATIPSERSSTWTTCA